MPAFVSSARRVANTAGASRFPLRLVKRPRLHLAELDGLRRAIGALETRWLSNHGPRKSCTRAQARRALHEVGETLALIALHLPLRTKRQSAYERDTFEPILDAIARATGHCPRCDARVASWAVPTGRSAFVPCKSHRATGGAL